MAFNIEELRETLDINRADITNNRSLTNEYLIEDLMLELGYNKRKDRSIRRIINNNIDWEVTSATGPKIAVKVFAVGEIADTYEVDETIKYCTEKRFSILIITNGEQLTIFRFNKEKLNYTEVCDINILIDLSEMQENVLSAISKDTFNLDIIDKLIEKYELTYEEVKEILENHTNELSEFILTYIDSTDEDVKKQCINIIKNNILCETYDNEVSDDNLNFEKIIESLKQEKEILESKISELETNANTQVNIENTNSEEIDKLQNELETCNKQKEYLELKINELETNKSELKEKVNTLETKNSELESEIDSLKSSNNTSSSNSGISQSEIDSYRNQIEDLANKYSEAVEKVDELKKELQEANDKLSNMSGADRQRAIDLLNVIEDNKELPRSYVAVINTELIQYDKIYTFVGRVLQKLYEIKSYTASQFIFNGDIFKLVQPSQRNDIIMNNKAYDIILDGLHEDEILNKLRIVLSHFDDVIFECKKIGSLQDNTNNININENNTNITEDFTSKQIEETSENYDELEINTENELGNNKTIEKEIEVNETEVFGNFDGFDELEISEPEQIESNNTTKCLLCGQLLQIDELIWNQDIKLNTIKYIGSSSITFNINMNCSDMSNEILTCRSIDAIIALANSMGYKDIIQKIRQSDLSEINSFIKLYTEEYTGNPRINNTKYTVANVDNIQQVASILSDLCNYMQIDTSDIFLFFDAESKSQQLADDWGYEEDAIQLNEYTEYNGSKDFNSIAIIKGNIFSNIIVTKNSLEAHRNILGDSIAVKTNYMAVRLTTVEDLHEAIKNIVAEAIRTLGHVDVNLVGNVIGEQYKFLSNDESAVGQNSVCLEIDGLVFYMSNIENWQIPLLLIKTHTTLLGNASIAVKTKVNSEALEFYNSEYEVAEPSLNLAVHSFVNYIYNCMKQV